MTTRFPRLQRFWARHRTLFWMLHSAWALATGAAIAYLSHERYHLVGWVALALAIAWASTLYFGRSAAVVQAHVVEHTAEREAIRDVSDADAAANATTNAAAKSPARHAAPPSLVHEVTSYVTRIMYQETLFFLLPFYAYSTVARSPNVAFLILLGALAAFSCIDIPFDRWLRTKPVFGFAFFAMVAFAALNLLLPLVFGLRVRFATPLSALVAVVVAVPLATRAAAPGSRTRGKLAASALGLMVLAVGFPVLVPPVPLRMLSASFSSGIDTESLALRDTLPQVTSSASVGGSLVVLVHIFAPTNLPARVHLVWRRDGTVLRTSREVEVTAHTRGFRAWDAWRPPTGGAPPGRYEVALETAAGRVIGEAKLTVSGTE